MAIDRILIVDDERNVRLSLIRSLSDLEVEVSEAPTGEEALELLSAVRFRLVLLEIDLPGMSGIDVLRALRRKHDDVPVIILTGHGTVENALEAMKLGAADFLQKPVAPDEIRDAVSNALRRRARLFSRELHGALAAAEEIVSHSGRPERLEEQRAYDELLQSTRRAIDERDFDAALLTVRRVISADPSRPEGYNVLGVLLEIKNETLQAQKYYRAALAVDPTYEPAAHNLSRTTFRTPDVVLDIGAGKVASADGFRRIARMLKRFPRGRA